MHEHLDGSAVESRQELFRDYFLVKYYPDLILVDPSRDLADP